MLRRSSSPFQSSDCRLWRSLYTAPGARCRFPWRVSTCRRALERRHRAHAPEIHGQRHPQRTPRGTLRLPSASEDNRLDHRARGPVGSWLLHSSSLPSLLPSQLLHHLERAFYVPLLGALGAANEQHDQRLSAARVINPVAGARIDSKLAQSVADRFVVTEVAQREPSESGVDAHCDLPVLQFMKPSSECFRTDHFEHGEL